MDDACRREVRLRGHALHRRGITRAAQTRPVATPADHHRRRRPKRTPALAAKFAAEFNIPFAPLDTTKTQFERVAAAVSRSRAGAGLADLLGGVRGVRGPRRAEIARRAAAIGREVDELRSNSPPVGTPAEIADKLGAIPTAGVQRVYLQLLDMSDLDHLEFFAAQVIPQLG